jgi:membrane-associated phospholipid phosphatase
MRPAEWLTLVAAVGLAVATAWLHPAGTALRLCVFTAIALATIGLARAPARSPALFLRDWLPVAEILAVFMLLQPIIEAAAPWRLDSALEAFDARYLAGPVAAWQGAFGRPAAFTDAMYLAYCSYYLLPVAAAVIAWRSGPDAFARVVFALLLSFYLTFVGYILLPASGPRLPVTAEDGVLGGGIASGMVRAFLHAAEATTLDAFPSGHTTVSIVAAATGATLIGRRAAAALWLWAAAVVFSTVYIHVHYAVDVLAGAVLALPLLGIDRAWRRQVAALASRAAGSGGQR